MSLDVKNGMHRLNSESDMEWFARVYALQESRIAELETSLDAMTARAAINGKEGLRYRAALERSELILLRIALGTTGNTHWQDLASTAADEAHQVLHPE
jgi:hypothetical protein